MRISEIFHSVQGEGQFEATPSVFVRTCGCNLRCWFCDTPYASWEPEGVERSWQDVLEEVRQFDDEHVVITGGEPMLEADLVPLTCALGELGRFVTVETAGTLYRRVHADLISLSPKLSNSTPPQSRAGNWTAKHDRVRHNPQVISQLVDEYVYQVKFVIDQPDDLDEVASYLAEFPQIDRERVWVMPQAITAEALESQSEWLRPEARRCGYRYSSRLHIELFGNVRGT